MRSHAEKAARGALFTALALVFSYVEYLIPFTTAVPGVKPGIANLAVLILLYVGSPLEALAVNIMRILLAGFLFGNLYGILYSLAGGIFSFFVMLAAKKSGRFSAAGVSIAGGTAHNAAQLAVAVITVSDVRILYYLPVLAAAGATAGLLTGMIAVLILPRIRKAFFSSGS